MNIKKIEWHPQIVKFLVQDEHVDDWLYTKTIWFSYLSIKREQEIEYDFDK